CSVEIGQASVSMQRRDISPKLLNSHDEDLVWIIERLVARTGSEFGALVRFLEEERFGVVLAATDSMPADLRQYLDALTEPPCSIRGTGFDQPSAAGVQQSYLPGTGAGGSIRVLCLAFQPASNVRLVVLVGRPDSAGPFSALQEQTAMTLYPVLHR